MILQQTIDKLQAMKLAAMADALSEWSERGGSRESLDPADLVGLLADAEWSARQNRRYRSRIRDAKFAMKACVENIDYRHQRGLKKQKMQELVSCRWIAAHQNVILTGQTGLGKTYLPCALGEKACRDGYRVLYTRAPRLFGDLYSARVDGSYPRLLQKLAKLDLLIIDDLGASPLEAAERRDLREVLEDRYAVSSTIITSQYKTHLWHSFIGDDTVADAICDRLVHNAHRFEFEGESMRKKRGLDTGDGATEQTCKAS